MPLHFFRALNPLSKNSGIENNEGRELIDKTLAEFVYSAFAHENYSLREGFIATLIAIEGKHYGRYRTSKGLLDFSILPLISRRLLAVPPLPSSVICIVFGAAIELCRSLVSLALLICLSPIVLLIHLIKRHCGFPLYPTNTTNHDRISHLNLDIPDEYLCPISGIIMTDPACVVNQPEQRFERLAITTWLRDNSTNPMNRSVLNLDDLQTDTDMSNRIEAYITARLSFQTAGP